MLDDSSHSPTYTHGFPPVAHSATSAAATPTTTRPTTPPPAKQSTLTPPATPPPLRQDQDQQHTTKPQRQPPQPQVQAAQQTQTQEAQASQELQQQQQQSVVQEFYMNTQDAHVQPCEDTPQEGHFQHIDHHDNDGEDIFNEQNQCQQNTNTSVSAQQTLNLPSELTLLDRAGVPQILHILHLQKTNISSSLLKLPPSRHVGATTAISRSKIGDGNRTSGTRVPIRVTTTNS